MEEYSETYEIRWSDIDGNGHVHYAAYIDAAGDLRYHFFGERGFPPERFVEMGIGPVYTSMNVQFLREVRMGEIVTITYFLRGLSQSGMRWRVHHDVLKANGKRAVTIDVEGMILDLKSRRAALPSAELLATFNLIPRDGGFEVLPELAELRRVKK
jgi:acyl-CoA thioester hydrolase